MATIIPGFGFRDIIPPIVENQNQMERSMDNQMKTRANGG